MLHRLPLVIEFCRAGFPVMGFDIDESKVALLNQGRSYIRHIDSSVLAKALYGCFHATADFSLLADMDCILFCVLTPLNCKREPDMNYVFSTGRCIAASLRKSS